MDFISMILTLEWSHANSPISPQWTTGNGKSQKEIGRSCANYHPSAWGDTFLSVSLDNKEELDVYTKHRVESLKEEVKSMLMNVSNSLQELNLIDAIQRLGVAYHFEKEIENSLQGMYEAYIDGNDDGDSLHSVALRFRLLRQQGYNVSSDVFTNFKDNNGKFKAILSSDIHGLLSLYEAAYLGTYGDDILDEAITFTIEHLKAALPHLSNPLKRQVEIALELPLRKRVERLQSRYYISIYEKSKDKNDVLLEFAKIDFNMLQSLHQMELRDISKWWKERDFAAKLPFIRDRVVECYFWILGVYFEPHYGWARRTMTTIISLTSIMDDIYDVYGTLEELELYTATLERWDHGAVDQLPEYMKLHFVAVLDAVDKFEEELSQEGKSYRISYLKEALKGLARAYLAEARWLSSGYTPKLDEYMRVALISCGYPMLSVISLVGMGDVVTKETLEWAINIPKAVIACSIICRLKDDIDLTEFEQGRGQPSAVQCFMNEHGTSYEDTCNKLRETLAFAWKELNRECLKPTAVPMPVLIRPLNLARVMELLFMHQDGYNDSTRATKEQISLVMVHPVPL